jgi:hypothetical protein
LRREVASREVIVLTRFIHEGAEGGFWCSEIARKRNVAG